MKSKNLYFTVDTDVNAIECDLNNADVTVAVADDEKLTAVIPSTKNISTGSGENGLIIKQTKRSVLGFVKQSIKIFVPAHTVPAVTVRGKNYRLTVENGIYGDMNLSADDGAIRLSGCVTENVEIVGGNVDVYIDGATVKSNAFLQIENGNVLTENTFAMRSEYRVKHGNIGLVKVNCKDCSFDTKKGNISATLTGSEDNFNTSITAREGTANKESTKHDGADGYFQAFAEKGNITLEFIEDKN